MRNSYNLDVFQLVLATFGSAFGGSEIDFDPNDARYEMTLDAPIFGIIPFSISETYSPDEFMSIVQGQSNEWAC